MKKIRRDHKGFTLVELIVVLVILAILAAILVPALLGWIDQAKTKQDVVNARALMVAMQTQMTEEYGAKAKSFSSFEDLADKNPYDDIFLSGNPDYDDYMDEACKLTGIEKPFVFLFYTKKISADDIRRHGKEALHDAYNIISAVYWADKESKPVYYDFISGEWAEGSPYSADLIKRGVNEIQKGPLKNTKVRVCIAGGTSVNAKHHEVRDTRVDRITNINNMILKVMDYTGSLNKGNGKCLAC